MKLVRVGVIGIGNMGSQHVLKIDQGQIEGATLAAILSPDENRIEWVKNHTKSDVQIFEMKRAFLMNADIDAVMIATPTL